MQKGAHKGGIYGIQVVGDRSDLILTCGKLSDIKLWKLESNEKGLPKMTELHCLKGGHKTKNKTTGIMEWDLDAEGNEIDETKMGHKIPRSMIAGGTWARASMADRYTEGNEYIILGTQGNEIIEYEINTEENIISIVEDSVLMNAHQNILRGLATHPHETRFVTASEDATVSVWDYDSRVLIGEQVSLPNWCDLETKEGGYPSPSQTCCISQSGDLIACGLTSGWFCVYSGCNSDNAELELVKHKSAAPVKKGAGPPAGVKSGAKETKLQKAMNEKSQARSGTQKMFKVEEACCIRFSPDDSRLAVGSRDNNIYIFDCNKDYRRIGICRGHSSYITHIDWSLTGEFLQSNSGDYELLYWQAPESNIFRKNHIIPGSPRTRKIQDKTIHYRWDQYRDMSDMADCQWHSWTSTLGFPVMGVWPPYSDGTDVNMVDRSKDRSLVVTAEDTFKISLMRYPCIKYKNNKGNWVGPEKKQFHGHMSHVMNVRWNNDDNYLFSAGGLDCCTFQWLHKEADGNPVMREEDEMEFMKSTFGVEPAAEVMTITNADDGYGEEEYGDEEEEVEEEQQENEPENHSEEPVEEVVEAPVIQEEKKSEEVVKDESGEAEGGWGEGEEAPDMTT